MSISFTNEQYIEIYEYLRYARAFGERIIYYIKAGKIAGAIHSPYGQEGVQAGLIMAAKYTPHKTAAVGTHRDQPANSKRMGLQNFINEMLCKQTGPCKGLAGEYHVMKLDVGFLPAQGILGGAWSWAVGYAWARRAQGNPEVVIAIYGDGATSEGVTYEAMNVAAIYKLPVVFFIENNGFAMQSSAEKEYPVEDLALRAQGCGMRGVTVDGIDPVAVAEALLEAIDLAAKGQPNVLEVKCTRFEGHFVGDPQGYRDPKYREKLADLDPVARYEKVIKEMGIIDDAGLQKIAKEQDDIMVAAFEEGFKQPDPTREQALAYSAVWSNNAGGAI
ncbi:MAG: thiamine pyrophosphate-dependent dehydrogenase E1 component subunit alpha [Clostridia bacterium]|nr:thiamine pyrophosphate-dependent dehydrogenase E1 component subunit alpha [Clostridia bacterium]MBQ1434984.1 thiamine pyrophosphate-dependent dehydrogenase E1 component subunit alpha [Clostridia bacterium]